MIDLHGIIARLSRHSIPTPAPLSSRASGQAGGGDLLPVSVGRPVAGMSPATLFSSKVPTVVGRGPSFQSVDEAGEGNHTGRDITAAHTAPSVDHSSDEVRTPRTAADGAPVPYWPTQEAKTAFLRALINGRSQR